MGTMTHTLSSLLFYTATFLANALVASVVFGITVVSMLVALVCLLAIYMAHSLMCPRYNNNCKICLDYQIRHGREGLYSQLVALEEAAAFWGVSMYTCAPNECPCKKDKSANTTNIVCIASVACIVGMARVFY